MQIRELSCKTLQIPIKTIKPQKTGKKTQKKTGKKSKKKLQPIRKQPELQLVWFCGRLRVFAAVCGVFAGVLRGNLVAKTSFSGFVVFANHCAFSIHLDCHKAPRCSAEQILICLMA